MTGRTDASRTDAPSPDSSGGSGGGRDPVELLAEEFLDCMRRGERPTVEEYAARHPELAEAIRAVFPALRMMEDLGGSSLDATGSHNSPARVEPLKGTPRQLGEYTILREVGRGGMGVVYEAVQQSLGRHVALKVLPWHQIGESSELQRFRVEARSAANLHHTNIVPVFGVGEDQGVHYYAMQFIRGQGLDDVIDELRRLRDGAPLPDADNRKRSIAASIAHGMISGHVHISSDVAPSGSSTASFGNGPDAAEESGRDGDATTSTSGLSTTNASGSLPTETLFFVEAARIALQVAEGLAYAHDQGIVHRDIKPSNLLMDTRGTVWISDFGLAKAEGSDGPTRTGDVVGTLRYMAPERFDGRADRRSDVYAVGATLYELITLRPLHGECDRARLVDRILREPPASPRAIDPRIPKDLETIVLKALDKDPNRRYPSAGALADDLRRFAEGRSISARPVPPWERLGKWARRRPAIAALVVAVHLLLATLLVMGIWSYVAIGRSLAKAQKQESRANQEAAKAVASARSEADARTEAEAVADELAWRDYINRVKRAYREVLDDNVAVADDLLLGCEEDHRDWEWHYVMRLGHMERRTLDATGESINAVAYSPDGSLIATGLSRALVYTSWPSETDAMRVVLWDVATGRPVGEPLVGPGGRIHSIAFSPDGTSLAVGSGYVLPSRTARVTVWDVATGEIMWKHESSLSGFLFGLSYSPDGTALAVGLGGWPEKLELTLLEPETGAVIGSFPGPAGGVVNDLSFHPDGERLALARYGCVEVLAVRDGSLIDTFPEHEEQVWDVTYSPDGRWLASSVEDGRILIRDAATGELRKTIDSPTGSDRSLAFSPDSRSLAAGGTGRGLRLWEIPSGRLLAAFHGHTDELYSVAFRPDGQEIASGSLDGTTKLWDASRREPVVLEGLTEGVYKLAYRRDGRRLIAQGGAIVGWDPVTGERDRTLETISFENLPPDYVRGSTPPYKRGTEDAEPVVESPDGTYYAQVVGDSDRYASRSRRYAGNLVQISNVEDGTLVSTLIGHSADVTGVRFSPDGRRIATISSDLTVKLWDVTTGDEVLSLLGHTDGLNTLVFSPGDGHRLVTGGKDGKPRVWDATPLPEEVLTRLQDSYEQKQETLEELVGTSTDLVRAEFLFRNGHYDLAAEAFDRAIERDPDDPRLQQRRLVLFWRTGNQERFRQASEEYLDRFEESTNPFVFGWCGRIHKQFGRWAESAEFVRRMVKIAPGYMNVRQTQVATLHRAGDVTGLRRASAELLDRYRGTTDPEIAREIVWALVLVPGAIDDPEEAVRMAQSVLDRGEGDADPLALRTLGAALYRARRFDEAIEKLEDSVHAHPGPGSPQAWAFLAMAYHGRREPEKARHWLERLRGYAPEDLTRDPDWYLDGEPELLLEEAQELIESAPTDAPPPAGSTASDEASEAPAP